MSYDIKDALLFAKLSDRAYENQASFTDFGFFPCEVEFVEHKRTDTQLYIIDDKEGGRIIVAFRGTEKFRDLMTDIDSRTMHFSFGGKDVDVHEGFLSAYGSVREQILDMIKKGKKVVFCGHSLGGGLATIAAFDFKTNVNKKAEVGCWTYGSPRVGKKSFVSAFNESGVTSHRFVNIGDPIPEVPIAESGFIHVDAKREVGEMTILITILKTTLSRFVRIKYHSLTKYIVGLEAKA